ncbi:MAG: GNAT family N-acetyltransferase [Oscillospiraceae bacterium]|nr:GNAT family N-acetyltransferase [Oscillospiraceae bacterium]
MNIRKATKDDIDLLIKFRFAYINDDMGPLSAEQVDELNRQLPDYFIRHIGSDFTAYIAEENGIPAAVIFYITIEKPANTHFINGKTAVLMNVYTMEEFRRRGAATMILRRIISDARADGVTCIDLSATKMGKPLYLKNGFVERGNTEMRLELR